MPLVVHEEIFQHRDSRALTCNMKENILSFLYCRCAFSSLNFRRLICASCKSSSCSPSDSDYLNWWTDTVHSYIYRYWIWHFAIQLTISLIFYIVLEGINLFLPFHHSVTAVLYILFCERHLHIRVMASLRVARATNSDTNDFFRSGARLILLASLCAQ